MTIEPVPELDQELGTILDYIAGDLIFAELPGVPSNVGEIIDLKQPDANQVQDMLDNDGKAQSLEYALVQPLLKVGWHLRDRGDEATTKWLEEMLRRPVHEGGMETPFDVVVAQKTSAFAFRRSYHEKVYKRENRTIVYKDIAWRPQSSCSLLREKPSGRVYGFDQWVEDYTDRVPIKKPYASIYVHGVNREPVHGFSDLQVAYRNYRTKEKVKFLWYTYLECLSLPRTILTGNSDEGVKKAAKAVAALKNAGVVGLPGDWIRDIKTLDVSGKGQSDFENALAYLDSDSALSILAGWTDLPSRARSGGTEALSSDQSQIFFDLLTAHGNELESHITQDILANIVQWNRGTKAKVPTFAFDEIHRADVSLSVQLLQAIAQSRDPFSVPTEFVKELILHVARDLGMDVDKLMKAIDKWELVVAKTATTQNGVKNAPLTAAATVGASTVQKARQQGRMK
jgi:Protein of unknown function (DUF935)